MASRSASVATLAAMLLAATNASANLIHRYLMEDGMGTTITDSVGTANGTAKSVDGGTGGWATGKFGGAWSSLANGFASFPSTGIPSTQGSFVQWVRVATGAAIWSDPLATHVQDPDHSWHNPMRVEINSANVPYVYAIPNGQPGGTDATIATSVPFRDYLWHQLVTTYDAAANETVFYVDGVRRGSSIYITDGLVTRATWRLGRREETSGSRAAALYDSTAVYDNVLTPEEVNTLFYRSYDGVTLNNVPAFSPGLRHFYPMATNANDTWDGYHGTVTGGAWVPDNPPHNAGGWQKTADAQNVILPMRVNLFEGTFEGWVKSGTNAADWSNPLATAIRAINEPDGRDSMRLEVTTGTTYIFDSPGAGTVNANFDTTDGQWHLIAFSYEDGESVKLYIDGLLRGESPGLYDVLLAYDRNLTILGSRTASEVTNWRGTVGTLAYYDFALTEADVASHWQNGISELLSNAIPEPATLSLLLVGLGAGLVRRRTRKVRRANGGS